MKINCIIDTCSCVYLSNAEFGQKNLLKYLDEVADLKFSPEVRKEIIDHKGLGLPRFINKDKYVLIPRKESVSSYQVKMLGKTLPSRRPGGSRGEVDNFIVAMDQLHHIKKGAMIYITDDVKAINGIIGEWLPSYPGIQCWTSYDVLLFLYAGRIIPSKDIAFDMLRDLNSVARVQEGRSEALNMKLQKILTQMDKKIEKISRINS